MDHHIHRLERADARNTFACAAARGRRYGFDAQYRWLAGGYAIWAGHWTHLTQGIGIGISGDVTPRGVQQVSRYFRSRQAVPTVYICDALPSAVHEFLCGGYRLLGHWNVLARDLHSPLDSTSAASLSAHRCSSAEDSDWIRACSQGFLSKMDLTADELEIGSIVAGVPEAVRFSARDAEGDVYGTGALTCQSRVALLFADSTRPAYRGKGAQSALIRSRLAHARAAKCDIAMAVVEPGSNSERNFLRHGFRKAYRRLTLQQS